MVSTMRRGSSPGYPDRRLSECATIFHCACVYPGVGQAMWWHAPPACDQTVVVVKWERGGIQTPPLDGNATLPQPHGPSVL